MILFWDRNEIAKYNFSKKYHKLDDEEKSMVNNVAQNIMSYHFKKPIESKPIYLTEGQLDQLTYALDHYVARQNIRDGETFFVNQGIFKNLPALENSHKNIQDALKSANQKGGDIILLAPGTYEENLVIDKPVTLRASRAGHVTIGNIVNILASR